jgi:hypothetical protein
MSTDAHRIIVRGWVRKEVLKQHARSWALNAAGSLETPAVDGKLDDGPVAPTHPGLAGSAPRIDAAPAGLDSLPEFSTTLRRVASEAAAIARDSAPPVPNDLAA